MVTGIYLLKFNGSDKVYVGQSVDIYKRFREHKNKLKLGKHQPKLTNAFLKYGFPELEVVCECSAQELDQLEMEAIDIWDSINNGYNFQKDSAFHGPSLKGEDNKKAQYSEDVYKLIFDTLIDSNLSIKEIAKNLNVNINVVYQISNGSSHRSWLEPKYPDRYKLLLNKCSSRNNKFSETNPSPPIYNKEGEIHFITGSLKSFAILNDLNESHLGRVLKGTLKQHKGWHL